MATVSPRSLLEKLNSSCRRGLEAAAGLCVSRTHFYVEVEHWLLKMLESTSNDLYFILRQYNINAAKVTKELEQTISQFKTGNGRSPGFSTEILDAIREGWTLGSLEYCASSVRSGHLLLAMLTDRTLSVRLRGSSPSLASLPLDKLAQEIGDLLPRVATEENQVEVSSAPSGSPSEPGSTPTTSTKSPALDQFTVNLTEKALKGEIDPVVGRDKEIRQVIDILTRRRQNNPILTGEAGVGKTAVVEGLALRIAEGDVPDPLKPVILRTLDLGLLQAGAGVKGEFENRLKSVIQEVKASPKPVILFIDEAHTLIGAGGAAGQNDAANLLKPALARGELRTIAATTFAEYKKFFETDAALKRRFQVVRVEEPAEAVAIRMLRGLVKMLEKHHQVTILDEGIVEAVRLSTRYIPDRQLPDKAVSLLDTVCARVRLSQMATPSALEDARREIEHLTTEIDFLTKEQSTGNARPERLMELKAKRDVYEQRKTALESQLEKERKLVLEVQRLRKSISSAATQDPVPESLTKDQAELEKVVQELQGIQGESPLVHPVVNGQVVAEVIAGLTGIPIGKMVRNEVETVLKLSERLSDRVIGQKHALEAIGQRIRTARADLADPRRPLGVFLLVGPSGVGKTETAMALADLLYGGDRNMVIVNMSEYKEASKVSRLTGTSKGYVGYGEGGVLTNAVKNRPYSVVLLDEIEKADESVQEVFYQVFDKGTLQNDDGEEVNFKNTIILLTSNVGTDTIMKACADPDTIPDAEGLAALLRPALLKSFKPALLGRMTVVPYFPLSEDVLKRIIELQLKKIGDRLQLNHKVKFTYDPSVIETIGARCKDVESGARNVDHMITGSVLPTISVHVLSKIAEGEPLHSVHLGVDAQSNFTYTVA
jgi:type VI secretion system protein VasG